MGVLYYPEFEEDRATVTFISDNEPEKGNILYRGYDIRVLSEQSTYEEVAYLLLFGTLPEAGDLGEFSSDLANNRELPAELVEMLKHMPRKAHPMDILRTAVAYIGAVDPEANDQSTEALMK